MVDCIIAYTVTDLVERMTDPGSVEGADMLDRVRAGEPQGGGAGRYVFVRACGYVSGVGGRAEGAGWLAGRAVFVFFYGWRRGQDESAL
jgi:hypothetical protein